LLVIPQLKHIYEEKSFFVFSSKHRSSLKQQGHVIFCSIILSHFIFTVFLI